METCSKLGIGVTPKAYIFEDHNIDKMQDLNGLVDKTKYFIGLSHQYGACQYKFTQVLRYYKQKHES